MKILIAILSGQEHISNINNVRSCVDALKIPDGFKADVIMVTDSMVNLPKNSNLHVVSITKDEAETASKTIRINAIYSSLRKSEARCASSSTRPKSGVR